MKAVTTKQMRDIEGKALSEGVAEEDLVEQAGAGIAAAVRKFFPRPGLLIGFIGKGHNGADALVAMRHLQELGWRIEVRPAFPEVEWAVLTRKKQRELPNKNHSLLAADGPMVILDGLLGIGGGGALRDPVLAAVREINELRLRYAASVVAVDLPSGLDADSGAVCGDAVIADFTITLGAPKCGLLAAAAVNHVGRLELITLDDLETSAADSGLRMICPRSFPQSLPLRAHDFHKGQAGRVAVIAGAPGMEGAALLAATAALRGGAGLVTLFVRPEIHAAVVSRACPELMVKSCADWESIDFPPFSSCVWGPGLGAMDETEFVRFSTALESCSCPSVIDADALNAIAANQAHHLLQSRHVITPHPGEFARLAPESARRGREAGCDHFTAHNPSVLLLKGARTLVMQRGTDLYHNSTGHAGMASGGMGDVLSGVIGALLGQGMQPLTAACCGAWLCGRAAELAMSDGRQSQHSLIATDLFPFLGAALHEWQQG
jgi:NAD(P)H-hydrate epimerase